MGLARDALGARVAKEENDVGPGRAGIATAAENKRVVTLSTRLMSVFCKVRHAREPRALDVS